MPVRAISLDLDDTVWPIAPAIVRAERALDAWLAGHAPRAAARWPLGKRRQLRARVDRERPHLAHDMTVQRRWMLECMLRETGEQAGVDDAYEAYFAARCQVEHYPDSLDALRRLAARVPLAAISNGNACLRRIGIAELFAFQLGAREHGAAKPDPAIFHAACARLGCEPAQVLHVGDDIDTDVLGAQRAGLRSAWLNRDGRRWPHRQPPDLQFTSLTALADWLDAAAPPASKKEPLCA